MSSRRAWLLVLAVVQAAFLLLMLAGHEPWAGPTVMALSETHGVNVGDIPVLALWAVGVVAISALWSTGS